MTKTQRYARQTVLPEIGAAGQAKIAAARVLCVGAGGLGCPVLQYLAGAGVGTIGIIDHDTVDTSNLHRQTLFATEDQGRFKAEAAAKKLRALNPEIKIEFYNEKLTAGNALELFSGYDIIVDGSDNFATKLLVNDAAVRLGKSFVHGAVQGFEGRVSVFNFDGGPCYRCLYPQRPQAVVQNCTESGVVGALAGVIGSVQALEAIKMISAHESFKPLSGRLWTIDGRTMETSTLKIRKPKDCICSHPEKVTLSYEGQACGAIEIDTARAKAMKDAVMIDVREDYEWEAGHIAQAKHIPLSALHENPGLLEPQAVPCIIYCQHGIRSLAAAEILIGAGHKNVYSLKGGYEAWRQRA